MIKFNELRLKEPALPAPQFSMVASTMSHFTISAFSWAPIQSVQSIGAEIAPGDAGQLAVKLYGPALERLADS